MPNNDLRPSSQNIRFAKDAFWQSGQLPSAWTEIYEKLPSASFFLSPEWTKTWIEAYGSAFSGNYLIWSEDGSAVAAALVLMKQGKFGPFRVRVAILNTSGEPEQDGVYIEYNDVLCLESAREAVQESLLKSLRSYRWDQLVFSGYSPDSLLADVVDKLGARRAISKVVACPFVDLAKVRQSGLLTLLSKSTRSQIQRCSRLYEGRGPLAIAVARSPHEGHEFLDTLANLHQVAWRKRGEKGAFESGRFARFHHSLIDRVWERDQLHLAKIVAGDQCIGVLYSFYSHGKAYFYQSGFAYEDDNRLKPGLLCHALMIEWYAKRGAMEYDFLAGDARYKKSLATHSRELVWTTVDRNNLKMGLLRWLSDRKARYHPRTKLKTSSSATSGPCA